jgi:exopolysaccharide production protein ExoZ
MASAVGLGIDVQQNSIKEKTGLVGIQYLRGLAALAVVVAHTSRMASFDKYFGREISGGFLNHGAMGVDLFFLISGFIICMISLRGPDMSPAMTGAVFAERRFTRIVPLMWLAILSYAALRLLGRGTFFGAPYLRALILFPAWDVQPNQIWTLRQEAIFYAIFAISFVVRRRKIWLLVCWAAMPVVYAALALPKDPSDFVGQFLRIVAHPVNIEFFTGFLIGILWHKTTAAISFSVSVSPFAIFLCYMVAIVAAGYALSLSSDSVSSTLISSIVCAPLLFAGIHIKPRDGPVDRFGRVLGNSSYSIYLFHPHFVSAILGVWTWLARETPIAIVLVVTTLMATSLCIFVHFYIERPLLTGSRVVMERLILARCSLRAAPRGTAASREWRRDGPL